MLHGCYCTETWQLWVNDTGNGYRCNCFKYVLIKVNSEYKIPLLLRSGLVGKKQLLMIKNCQIEIFMLVIWWFKCLYTTIKPRCSLVAFELLWFRTWHALNKASNQCRKISLTFGVFEFLCFSATCAALSRKLQRYQTESKDFLLTDWVSAKSWCTAPLHIHPLHEKNHQQQQREIH